MNKKIIIGGVIVIAVIGLIWVLFGRDGGGNVAARDNSTISRESKNESIDVVLDFYNQWIEERLSEETDPYKSGLARDPILNEEVRIYLNDARKDDIDPVLCHEGVPSKIRTKVIFDVDGEAQILILPKAEGLERWPLIDLKVIDDLWHITNIACSQGEVAPEKEFTFEREGFLLKDSVRPPLNAANWHLVFAENGQMGFTTELSFTEESECRDEKDDVIDCEGGHFGEGKKVFVQGDAGETAVAVKRLRFVE